MIAQILEQKDYTGIDQQFNWQAWLVVAIMVVGIIYTYWKEVKWREENPKTPDQPTEEEQERYY